MIYSVILYDYMSYEIGRSDVGQDRTTTLARLDWPLSLLCLINYFHRRAILVIVKQHYHISLLYVLCAERNGTTVSERSLSRVFTLNGVGTNNTISTPFYPLPNRKRPRCSSKNTRFSFKRMYHTLEATCHLLAVGGLEG